MVENLFVRLPSLQIGGLHNDSDHQQARGGINAMHVGGFCQQLQLHGISESQDDIFS